MENRHPLLLFKDKVVQDRVKKQLPFSSSYHFPSHESQGKRLEPKFKELRTAITAGNIDAYYSSQGIDPEYVIVFETVGAVDDFHKAVRRIGGMEWLGVQDLDSIEQDEYFYDTKDTDKALEGRLYLTFTSKKALSELLRLWELYSKDPNSDYGFGLTKFRDVFAKLKDVRRWDYCDRLIESGAFEYWKFQLEHTPQDFINFEIELWFRESSNQRKIIINRINDCLQQLGGEIITSTCITQIAYFSVLAKLPKDKIDSIIKNPDVALVNLTDIMFFKPSGQIVASSPSDENMRSHTVQEPQKLLKGSPEVALLDGLPMENHSYLTNRIIVDDPDEFVEAYIDNSSRRHGTAMASLIIHGDIANNQSVITTPLYVRPIYKPIETRQGKYEEIIPSDVLLVDLIHRAVKRIFTGDSEIEPLNTIKVINLSFGDPSRMYINAMSPLARLLDWLSVEYNVLFNISAGNQTWELDLKIRECVFERLSIEGRERLLFKRKYDSNRQLRILSPAESVNSLCISSLHKDESKITPRSSIFDPFTRAFPAMYSPISTGYNNSMKPDLIFDGGRQFVYYKNPTATYLSASPLKVGNLVALPSDQRDRIVLTRGTSNSTALITHYSWKCLQAIKELQVNESVDEKFYAVILKAYIAHGCTWDSMNIRDNIDSSLKHLDDLADKEQDSKKRTAIRQRNSRIRKIVKEKCLGYGYPDFEKVFFCTDSRATVVGFDEILPDDTHVFKLPIPQCLSGKKTARKLTITLAYFTPISPLNRKYKDYNIWFDTPDKVAKSRSHYDDKKVKRGTLQHEIFEESAAHAFVVGDELHIKVSCRHEASSVKNIRIKYALLVTLESTDSVKLPIYQEIKEKLQPRVSIMQSLF